jgi:hypothetical protein
MGIAGERSGDASRRGRVIGFLLDTILDRTVVAGYTSDG